MNKFWKLKKSKKEETKAEILDASFKQLEKEERESNKPEKSPLWQRIWVNKISLGYLLGGIVALGLVMMLYPLYTIDRGNSIVATGLVVGSVGGVFLFFRAWKATRQEEAVIVGATKPIGEVNSLNIYARKDKNTGKLYPVKVAFEMILKPEGQPQQCTNNGKWYYVNIFDMVKQRLVPFVLPDSQYFDPREFANVITMPAHQKLFERQASLLQKVAPGIMLLAFVAALLGMVMTAPT